MADAQTCGPRTPRLPSSVPQWAPSSSAGWNSLSRPFSRPELCRVSTLQRSGVLLVAKRSEEHTSELQSRLHLVCRLLLEKKKKKKDHRDYDLCHEHYIPEQPIRYT